MSSSSSGRWGCLSVFLVLILAVSVLLNVLLFTGLQFSPDMDGFDDGPRAFKESALAKSSSSDKIVVLDLDGIISDESDRRGDSMVDTLTAQLKQAREDESVKAVILRINSPGGEVNASDVIYHELTKTRAKKPVVSFFKSVAASGGYYAAMGTSYLVANEQTITGSIGVIMQSVQYKGLMEKVGLKMNTFKSGKFKDLGAGDREMTPEEQAYLQKFVADTYEAFVGIVAKERKLSLDNLKAGVADGRILSGSQALAERIVDKLGYFEDAAAKANELAGTKDAKLVEYEHEMSLGEFLSVFATSRTEPARVELAVPGAELRLKPGQAYYLSQHLFAP